MATETWGTGVDEFTLTYSDNSLPTTGIDAFYSEEFGDNVFSCWLDESVFLSYTAGEDTNPNNVVPTVDTPLYWHYISGTSGPWTYDYNPSLDVTDGFFTKYSMRYKSNTNTQYVVENVTDLQRMVWIPTVSETTESVTLYGESDPVTVTYYDIDYTTNMSMDIMKKSDPTTVLQNVAIMPCMLHNFDYDLMHGYFYSDYRETLSYQNNTVTRNNGTYSHGQNNALRLSPEFGAINDLPSGSGTIWEYDTSEHYLMKFEYNSVYMDHCYVNYYIADEDHLKFILAGFGLKFKYKGVVYKPIVQQGMVVGYTDDMTEQSEWDNWHDYDDHVVPDEPPSPVPPTPSGDEMESQALGASGSSGGFTKFFVMSPENLSDFLTDFYNRAEPGETLSGNIVCSYILGVPSTNWASVDSKPITIQNSAQGTPFVSAANYSHVTGTNNYIVAGNFEVPRKTGTFYDFAPYSTYELFIPCCGWITLPDTVAGRNIYVSIQIDIATCGAKGVVKFDDGATCAVCSGVLGSSIPMEIIESGLLRGANVQAASSALGGALMAGSGFGNGNVGFGLGGISQVVNSFTQSAIAGNTNYTNQKGSSGDITQFAMGHNCYLKITYPPVDSVVNDSMFGHTVGYLCEEVGKLSSFHGFTVCANPHVHINATSAEKEEIKQLLEEGVILP